MIHAATLLGSSSGRNAGDAALISGLMESVDAQCAQSLRYEIPTIKPGYIRNNYPRSDARPIAMLPWNFSVKMLGQPTYRSIMRTDLTLIFDAILFDRSLYNPLFNFMSTLYLLLPRARKKGKKMAFYNVGAGPVNTVHGQKMLRELSELMDFITVRDEDSLAILKNLGVKNQRILLGADAALTVPPSDPARVTAIFDKLDLKTDEEILGININKYLDTWAGPGITPMGKERFVTIISETLNQIGKKLNVPLLFVTTQHHDVPITREVIARLNPDIKSRLLTNIGSNHYDIKGALSRISLLFGMRLHSLILASSEHTPIIGLAYQPKVRHYLRTLDLEKYCIGFEPFSEESLVQQILNAWDQRSSIKKQLDNRVPALQQRAHQAAELVAALHREKDLDEVFAKTR